MPRNKFDADVAQTDSRTLMVYRDECRTNVECYFPDEDPTPWVDLDKVTMLGGRSPIDSEAIRKALAIEHAHMTEDELTQLENEFGDELAEWVRIRDFCEEASREAGRSLESGFSIVRDDRFVEYAQEYSADISASGGGLRWPFNHIDWEAAAKELQQDWASVEFNDESYDEPTIYWVR